MSTSGALPLQTFLIIFKSPISQAAYRHLVENIQSGNGSILLTTGDGRTLIATTTQSHAENLRQSPYFDHVGGVRIGQRRIVRKQVVKES